MPDTTKQMKATGAHTPEEYEATLWLVRAPGGLGNVNDKALPIILSALQFASAQSNTRAALEGARTVLADAIYLFDHPKQSEDEALCIRAMKAAGRTIQAALNPDGEKS